MTKRMMMEQYSNSKALPVLPPRRDRMDEPHHTSTFTLPLPSNFRTVCPTREVIDALNHAISHKDRTDAFKRALQAFSHTDVELHNYEMRMGVDKALCLKLGYVVVTYSNSSEQIALVCQCLVKVYQCSVEYRLNSFREIGASEIIPLLVQVWKRQVQVAHQAEGENHRNREHILLSALKVLRVYAKLDESAKSFLIQYDEGSLVVNFMQMIGAYCEQQRQSPMGCESPDLILELLGMFKDLTFRSHTIEKEFLLRVHGGISKHVISQCCSVLISNSKVAEILTAILWNLVLTPNISVELLQHESDPLAVPRTLCRILTTSLESAGRGTSTRTKTIDADGQGKDIRHYSTKTRRNAVSALGNLLLATENQKLLFKRSVLQQLDLIPTLMNLVERDPDSITRRRSMRTLRLLSTATQNPGVEPFMCPVSCLGMLLEHDIVAFLANTISRNVDEDDENDRDTQIQACESVIALAMGGLKEDENWPQLERALIKRIETTTDPRLTLAACRCLSLCVAESNSWKMRGHPSLNFSDMFWKRLECTVSTFKDSHVWVSTFLLQLTQQEANHNSSSSVNDTASSLSCNTVVNTLTCLLSEPGCEFEDSRDNALKVVVILVQKEINKRPLAENENLLTALVNLCLLQPPGPSAKRDLAKKLILDLVPEL